MKDWRLRIAQVAAAIGAVGFFLCWSIGWTTETRVFGDSAYASKGPTRQDAVSVKSKIYYLEPAYARQYNASQQALGPFVLLVALGGGYIQFRKRKDDE